MHNRDSGKMIWEDGAVTKALRMTRHHMVEAATKRGTRAAIYIRVSTKREEMISPEVQEGHSRSYCDRKGYSVVAIEKDLGYSGGSSAKRKIGKMIQAVRDGEYDVIVVWQLSRWGRSLLDSLLNVDALQEAGGRLESATESLENIETPFGEFTFGQLLLIAQLQRKQIRASWMDAHKHRIDDSLPHSGGVRFGYVYHVRQKEKREEGLDPELLGTYEVDPITGAILATMYRDYLNGRSFIAIARDLNARGITGALGGRWTHATVRQVLDNGFGAGWVKYREVMLPGKHEAVITDSEWARYVSMRLDGEKVPARTAGQKARFKRFVWCARCDRRMALVRWRQHKKMASGAKKLYVYEQWRCAGQDGGSVCKGMTVAASVVEHEIKAWLEREMVRDPGTDAVTRRAQARRANSTAKKLRGDRTRIKAAQAKLLDLYLAPRGFTAEQLDQKTEELDAELRQVEMQLAECEADVQLAKVPRTTAYKALLEAWEILDPDLFNIGFEKVINKIVIHSSLDTDERVEVIPRYGQATSSAA